MFDGISGLVTQPLRGAEKEGTAGLIKGIGKGVAGLILKPGAGTFSCIFGKPRPHISCKCTVFPVFHIFDISVAISTSNQPTSMFASKGFLNGSNRDLGTSSVLQIDCVLALQPNFERGLKLLDFANL